MMNIIKPILVVYTAFLLANVIPSLQIKQTMVVFALTSGIILVSYKDPTLSVMLLIALVINIDFLGTTPMLEDIEKVVRIKSQPPMIQTVTPSPMTGIDTRSVTDSPVRARETPSVTGSPVRASETPSVTDSPVRAIIETPSSNACDKSLIISKQMLANAQTNIYEKKNMNKYPNELNNPSVNIQGLYDDVSGFKF
jgi:hypothetical protein